MRAASGEGAPIGIQDAIGQPADEIILAGGVFDVADPSRSDLVSRLDAVGGHGRAVDGLVAANDTESALTIRVANKAIVAFLVGSLSTIVGEELIPSCWQSEDLRRSQRVFAEKPTSQLKES